MCGRVGGLRFLESDGGADVVVCEYFDFTGFMSSGLDADFVRFSVLGYAMGNRVSKFFDFIDEDSCAAGFRFYLDQDL